MNRKKEFLNNFKTHVNDSVGNNQLNFKKQKKYKNDHC